MMTEVNHFCANSEFRGLNHDFKYEIIELEDFLRDIHKYITDRIDSLEKELDQVYSASFDELFWKARHEEIFRRSFIISLVSVTEAYIKEYCKIWSVIVGSPLAVNSGKGILEILKDCDKIYFGCIIDQSHWVYQDMRMLMGVRNSIVHLNGDVSEKPKYKHWVLELGKKYNSIELALDKLIVTTERFCWDAIKIVKRFLFLLFRAAIRKFPLFKIHEPNDWDECNCSLCLSDLPSGYES